MPSSPDLVVKIPNIDVSRSTSDIEGRTTAIQRSSIEEWAHVRKRLTDCHFANPIFDMGTVWIKDPGPLLQLTATVQPFLRDGLPLKDWLVENRLRSKINFDATGREISDWTGISEWQDWLNVATMVAKGLAEIHSRRVIHGDIWPPNIYINTTEQSHVVLIDFGESFISTPSGEPRTQPDHPYRAPERDKQEYVPTEQVDVYSFGKLLLYLTVGEDIPIPRDIDGRQLVGHRRRAFVRECLMKATTKLAKQRPSILDLIAQCTAWDPVDRPAMNEVQMQLSRLQPRIVPSPGGHLAKRLGKLAEATRAGQLNQHRIFSRFVERKKEELNQLEESCRTEMVEVSGTRDALIGSLVTLFDEMEPGDSWTTLTAPSVWQHEGLGLDGRYATATIEAVLKGAAVHRTYTVSVDEIGLPWAEKFEQLLGVDPALKELQKAFSDAIAEYKFEVTKDWHKERSSEMQCERAKQLVRVLKSLGQAVNDWGLGKHVFQKRPTSIRSTPGLYLGLVPVGTSSRVKELRTKNPVSLLYLNREVNEEDKWLLVMTDIRGRNEYETGLSSWPQLRGIRIYKSKMKYPKDRVIGLETLMKSSVNIGSALKPLMKILQDSFGEQ